MHQFNFLNVLQLQTELHPCSGMHRGRREEIKVNENFMQFLKNEKKRITI